MRKLFDYEYQLESINQYQPPLQKLDKVINWEMFRAPIEEALYKEQLKEKKVPKQLLDLSTQKLISKGVVAKEGSMVDASFVDVPKQRNSREDNRSIKEGNIPESFKENPAKLAQKDTDARWMTKNGERHFGYKDPINADVKTKLITTYSVSSTAPYDSTELENVISKKIEESLKAQNITSHVHEKGYRNHPLDEQQKITNKMKSKIRVRVEHIFGYMTNSMNDALHMCSIGIERIESNIGFMNLTYNLFRYEQLVRLKKIQML